MQDANWDDLRVLLALARCGSFAGAARRLGVNESTVLRRYRRLSRRLDARLFERSRAGLVPTPAGLSLLQGLELAETAIDRAEASLAGENRSPAGLVRLTAVPLLANRLLVPALPALLGPQEGLELELIAEPSVLSVMRREVDIALRLARPEGEPQAIARRAGRLAYAPCRAAGSAADLPWVTYGGAMAALPQARWVAAEAARRGEALAGLRVNDGEALVQAVRAGLGKALLPLDLLRNEVGIAPCGPPCLWREVWTLVHPELRDLARLRVTLEWLDATLAALPHASGP